MPDCFRRSQSLSSLGILSKVSGPTKPNGYKYIGWGLLLFNVLYGIALYVFCPRFAELVQAFPIFFTLYVVSIVIAVFGLIDNRALLLWPLIIATLPFIIIPMLIWLFHLTNLIYCSFANNTNKELRIIEVDPDGDNPWTLRQKLWSSCSTTVIVGFSGYYIRSTTASLIAAGLFFLVFAEKLIEFLFFRRLQKEFAKLAVQRELMAIEELKAEVANKVMVHKANIDQPTTSSRSNKNFFENHPIEESDEDMIVYEGMGRKFNANLGNIRSGGFASIARPQPSPSMRRTPTLPKANSKRTIS